jgi:drug/metabolite transporter (DMT)-like permease
MNSYFKGILLTSLSAILFGLNPLFVFLLTNNNVSIYLTLFIRFVGSLLIYLFFIIVSKRNFILIKEIKLLLKILISSFFFLSTAGLLVYSYTKIDSGLTTVLHFSYPIIITILSVWTKRDKLNLTLILAIIISIIGVVLVTNPFNMECNVVGVSTSLLSALTFAIYLFMLNDKDIKKLDNNIFVVYLSLFSVLLLIISLIFFSNNLFNYQSIIYSFETVFGTLGLIGASAVGVIIFSCGARKVGGPIAGTISSFEPLTAVLIGVLYLNESAPKYYKIGVFLIIFATALISLFSTRKNKIVLN